jgi:glycine dehydrogenase subunit 1
MGAMHMSLLGPDGLEQLALRNMAACQLAKAKLAAIDTIALPHLSGHHYNEFVVELPGPASECLEYMDSQGIIGGYDLSNWFPERKNWLLVTVTDQNTAAEVKLLGAHLEAWSGAAIRRMGA